MTDEPIAFVVAFHENLTAWFSGMGERAEVWARLVAACPASLTLVYPSGTRLQGDAFTASIEDRFGSSPGFTARIEDPELVHRTEDTAVVAYVEAQSGARASTAENRRSALAVVERDGVAGWRWRYIQETALP